MDALKRQAAARALEEVRDGMKLGLGTGSTAKHFVELLGEKVRAGLKVVGVPTSEATRAQAEQCGVPLTTLDEIDHLDLTVDGADEIDRALNLIKGGGGALLREKIVAAASDRMIVIADEQQMGRCARPLSAADRGRFRSGSARRGAPSRRRICAKAAFPGKWRCGKGRMATFSSPMAATGSSMPISDGSRMRRAWQALLSAIPGVVEHGLFIGTRRARSCWRARREFA